MGIEVGGLFGLLLLVADIWAIVKTVQSGASTGAKVVWIALILLLPLLGLILWLVAGPKNRNPTRDRCARTASPRQLSDSATRRWPLASSRTCCTISRLEKGLVTKVSAPRRRAV